MDTLSTLLFRVKVSGESCWPELTPGKTYFASRLRSPRVGDYVVFPDPSFQSSTPEYRVKKVNRIDGDTLHTNGTVSWSSSYILNTKDILATIIKKQ